MNIRTLLLVITCSPVLGCGGTDQRPEPPAAEHSDAAAEIPMEESVNTVRIDEGMLRELRITVEEVESRPGGEQITLLGELAVDERAYAEVGVPLPSRVTRLMASHSARGSAATSCLSSTKGPSCSRRCSPPKRRSTRSIA
jgi:hypothetical protein